MSRIIWVKTKNLIVQRIKKKVILRSLQKKIVQSNKNNLFDFIFFIDKINLYVNFVDNFILFCRKSLKFVIFNLQIEIVWIILKEHKRIIMIYFLNNIIYTMSKFKQNFFKLQI